MRNARVFDGFGTAAHAECLVSVYSLALVELGEAPHLSRCPLHPHYQQQGVVEGIDLLSSCSPHEQRDVEGHDYSDMSPLQVQD